MRPSRLFIPVGNQESSLIEKVGSDNLAASLGELAAVAGYLSALDTLDISLSEVIEIISRLSSVDSLDISFSSDRVIEIVSGAVINKESNDAFTLSLTSLIDLFVTAATSDNVNVVLSESWNVFSTLEAIDSVNIDLLELFDISVLMRDIDALDVDISSTALVEVLGSLKILFASDNVDISLSELIAILVVSGATSPKGDVFLFRKEQATFKFEKQSSSFIFRK